MLKPKVNVLRNPIHSIKELEAHNKRFRGRNHVKVGLPKGSNDYPDGTSVIMVGAVQEFGSIKMNVPERSYLRATLLENKGKYKKQLRILATKVSEEKITMQQAMGLLGQIVKDDVIAKIESIDSPALADSTIFARMKRTGQSYDDSQKPLMDTLHLLRSIDYEVAG